MSEEPLGVDDLKRQLVRLEMLLSEVTVQNSHLKGENSQLFAVCEQTKSEYTRLLHKLDTMEEIFFRQGKERRRGGERGREGERGVERGREERAVK